MQFHAYMHKRTQMLTHIVHANGYAGEWTAAEGKKLIALAIEHNYTKWEVIARELPRRRGPADVFAHFQRHIDNHSEAASGNTVGPWSEEETAALQRAIALVGSDRNWVAVARVLREWGVKRDQQQCIQRYKKLDTTANRGKWSAHELKLLQDACYQHIRAAGTCLCVFVCMRVCAD
jgi:hypothetical protein